MSYYRDVYLKSDEWKTLRLQRLILSKFKCELCGVEDPSNDVHHMRYRSLYNVKVRDLRTMCRDCHDKTHFLLKKYKKLKTLSNSTMWKTIRYHLVKGVCARKLYAVCEWRTFSGKRYSNMTRAARYSHLRGDFKRCRRLLHEHELVYFWRMPWRESVTKIAVFLRNPVIFLEKYKEITGVDPSTIGPSLKRDRPCESYLDGAARR